MERIPLTARGLKRLEAELAHLKSVERPAVIKAIEDARAHGDLSENAEYHAARERQSFVEGRINELEDKTSRAEVIDVQKLSGDTIKFGATVRLSDELVKEKSKYQIVGVDEADIKQGLLPINSPLARSLIGKKVNDIVEVKTPRGEKVYKILDISFV
ncbi:MAG: transcription elongation factor GreA [Alphaproteobacteria bacterium RIFCSPLOWO2_01_FULL_45_8]|nr:MAG: transcription elongation factor GreA [Alphaproteobacteria bacterium GWB1_45_5]OFW76088.1 MAG: transcription elongation factor GreA [Alphaproteobacteria bacterium GWA1_45_9]OFW90256.1 MAG: transcription elongation factor GreA [Alphaproteobacteria bacterium RIFCSPHIGHO2_01_FULL_41_14]OFW95871.1 MAG: transcription elongation factor GreA [Alphaproteobacteria bacterium RIFCSPLOWO2_01_FULL_45_8]HCI48283.1 transcription elongation factor GreA [Holosporales bacterium]